MTSAARARALCEGRPGHPARPADGERRHAELELSRKEEPVDRPRRIELSVRRLRPQPLLPARLERELQVELEVDSATDAKAPPARCASSPRAGPEGRRGRRSRRAGAASTRARGRPRKRPRRVACPVSYGGSRGRSGRPPPLRLPPTPSSSPKTSTSKPCARKDRSELSWRRATSATKARGIVKTVASVTPACETGSSRTRSAARGRARDRRA